VLQQCFDRVVCTKSVKILNFLSFFSNFGVLKIHYGVTLLLIRLLLLGVAIKICKDFLKIQQNTKMFFSKLVKCRYVTRAQQSLYVYFRRLLGEGERK